MPTRKKKPIGNSAHEKVEDSAFDFEVPGETLIALHNALAFTLSHKDVYGQEIDVCEHCIDAMNAMRRQIERILEYSEAFEIKKKKALN